MNSIENQIFDIYDSIQHGQLKCIKEELDKLNISILNDFLNNRTNIDKFSNQYIAGNNPEVVICGINPGKRGAGKTGIPFLDFNSLAKLIDGVARHDEEASATFFYSVISYYGSKKFYSRIYVTNLSCLGFLNNNTGKNVNYYKLPQGIQKVLIRKFIDEMNIVNPKVIIPCSEKVNETLMDLKSRKLIKAEIENKLNHPYYCSIKCNTDREFRNYIAMLNKYIA